MNIITISREFGSGGRELGQHIADILGYDYYDREIISAIAENSGLDENYIENALSLRNWRTQLTFNHGVSSLSSPSFIQSNVEVLQEQTRVIEDIGKAGRDFVIIGRCADLLLRKYQPFDIFVCASMDSKISRCMGRSEFSLSDSPKEIRKQIQRIDKERAQTRRFLSDIPWGNREGYHLIVNTSGWDLEELAPAVCEFAKRFFERKES